MKKLVLLVFLLISYGANSQIFKWVDGQGNIHFSDTPHPGAVAIDIPTAQSYSPPTPRPPVQPENPTTHDKQEKVAAEYTRLEIVQPHNGATVRNNQGAATILVVAEPRLAPKNKLQLFLDGTPIGKPQSGPSFELEGIYKGAHNFTVEIIDNQGKVLKTSDSITVYFQRARIGMGSAN